ncbi:FlgN protein [Krasilnikovia cinnamomea]|uniref:FlgN protein n=1 Tax=Krasilnikovia cinnamomea TaxID=349313 RepID=A0A4Q7ZHZ5_9ACTN|nr:flagellar protein FlgN [Krasilnikovia cinnamomea]RZU50447.1 FlgN protein [Krasilnikovia cinnamomea]
MSLTDLSSVLWRSRELLELLLFKLEEEQLILAAGRTRWLPHATREVEVVLDQIRQTEVARAAYSQGVAVDLGLAPEASLGELADAAPEPWSDLLHQHRKAFLTLTAEINGMASANRELLTAGQRAVRDTMHAISGNVETYGRQGQTVVGGTRRPSLVDEAI